MGGWEAENRHIAGGVNRFNRVHGWRCGYFILCGGIDTIDTNLRSFSTRLGVLGDFMHISGVTFHQSWCP